jgi:hypothetical protein
VYKSNNHTSLLSFSFCCCVSPVCFSVFRFCCNVSLSSGSVAVPLRLQVLLLCFSVFRFCRCASPSLGSVAVPLPLLVLSLRFSVFRFCCYVFASSGSVVMFLRLQVLLLCFSVFMFCRCVSPVHIPALFYAQSCTSVLLLQKDLLPKAGDYRTTPLNAPK